MSDLIREPIHRFDRFQDEEGVRRRKGDGQSKLKRENRFRHRNAHQQPSNDGQRQPSQVKRVQSNRVNYLPACTAVPARDQGKVVDDDNMPNDRYEQGNQGI